MEVAATVLTLAGGFRLADQLQLAYLYVTRAYRARGVGTQLFEAAVSCARAAGANAVYVSATPTENTVDFYLKRGCVLAAEPDPRLLAAEPEASTALYRLHVVEVTSLEVTSHRVFVDPFSAQYISGVVIDYTSSMQGSGFTFKNPNATGGCGCGSSFGA